MVTTSKPGFLLYSTSACHLCEQAAALLQPWLAQGWSLHEVDISEDDALFERYGLIIPVLAIEQAGKEDQRELNWPFTGGDIAALIEAATCRP